MTITIEQLKEAARVGYPVCVVVNGEEYNLILDDTKKEGKKE